MEALDLRGSVEHGSLVRNVREEVGGRPCGGWRERIRPASRTDPRAVSSAYFGDALLTLMAAACFMAPMS